MKKNGSQTAPIATMADPGLEAEEVYALFVEEMEARRQRLRQLLQMVTMQAKRGRGQKPSAAARNRCRRTAGPIA